MQNLYYLAIGYAFNDYMQKCSIHKQKTSAIYLYAQLIIYCSFNFFPHFPILILIVQDYLITMYLKNQQLEL